jgi:hypothetical protein
MTFWVSVIAKADPADVTLTCANKNNCKIVFRRAYTPTIFYIAPRVTYYESYTELWFDPASTMGLIEDLDTDEIPFINAKVGDNLLDFEFGADSTTLFAGYSKNRVRGQVGENTISKNQNLTMMWETGNAAVALQEATFCDFDQTSCYQGKSVPVIFNISSNTGYVTGGQNITVQGYGFDAGVVTAVIDGQPCTVTSTSRYEFDCTVQAKSTASDVTHAYAGQLGVTRHSMTSNAATNFTLSWANIDTAPYTKLLAMNLESEYNFGSKLGSVYKTWFVAPAAGRYRFYMTCDDRCELKMATCPDAISPLTTLLEHTSYSINRAYFTNQRRTSTP